MLEGVPNLAFAIGYTNASWTLKCDLTCRLRGRLLNHLHAHGLAPGDPAQHDAAVTGEPLLGLNVRLRPARRRPRSPSRAPGSRGRCTRATCATTGPGVRSQVQDDGPAELVQTRRPARRGCGRVAAVTGAGSGIGRALAVELARRGTHLALCDVDEAGLAETVALCEGRGVKVTSAHVDVADRDAVYAWADLGGRRPRPGQPGRQQRRRGAGRHGRRHVRGRPRVAHGHQLLGRGARHQGLPAPPGGVGRRATWSTSRACSAWCSIPTQSAYNAAKFAVRGFTEALRMELELAGSRGHRPRRSTPAASRPTSPATPASTRTWRDWPATPEERAEQFERLARTTPEGAARQILAAVERGQAAGADRSRRQDVRPAVPAARRRVPAGDRGRGPPQGLSRPLT